MSVEMLSLVYITNLLFNYTEYKTWKVGCRCNNDG